MLLLLILVLRVMGQYGLSTVNRVIGLAKLLCGVTAFYPARMCWVSRFFLPHRIYSLPPTAYHCSSMQN
ncbi:MAG: hypothetical protein H0W34_10305 [Pyrinomonadaceae bacterium]|nr:hypothetical protein [Pyrinomonadaceae bacterium]